MNNIYILGVSITLSLYLLEHLGFQDTVVFLLAFIGVGLIIIAESGE